MKVWKGLSKHSNQIINTRFVVVVNPYIIDLNIKKEEPQDGGDMKVINLNGSNSQNGGAWGLLNSIVRGKDEKSQSGGDGWGASSKSKNSFFD